MTHIENAIRDAVEKGEWMYLGEHRPRATDKAPGIASFAFDGFDFLITKEQAFLDPAFWQALGKARGWDTSDLGKQYKGETWEYQEKDNTLIVLLNDWENAMHDFIDHLASGADAESFFATIEK